jgi:hypothetical protein
MLNLNNKKAGDGYLPTTTCLSFLVRVLNSLIFLKTDVKSRFAGAGFWPAKGGFRLAVQPTAESFLRFDQF